QPVVRGAECARPGPAGQRQQRDRNRSRHGARDHDALRARDRCQGGDAEQGGERQHQGKPATRGGSLGHESWHRIGRMRLPQGQRLLLEATKSHYHRACNASSRSERNGAMTTRVTRPRRSCLSVPGSSPKMLQKSPSLPADEVFMDLEDSVAPLAKEEARGNVIQALKEGDWTGKTRVVRINGVYTSWCYGDVIEIAEKAGEHLDCIMFPRDEYAVDRPFLGNL